MTKTIAMLIGVFVLAGCTDPIDQWQNKGTGVLKNIKGLEDCTYTQVFTGSVHLHVVRCPNSTVNVKTAAKHPVTTITVDGVEYVQKQ